MAVALVAVVTAVTSAQAPVAIGLVRADGYLIPIALVTPRLFTRSYASPRVWPFKDLKWTLFDHGGRNPVEIATIAEQSVQMPYCDDRSLWRTTAKQQPVRKGYVPIPKLGLAVSGASLVFPEDVKEQPDVASRSVARRILSLFRAKEEAALAREKATSSISNSMPVVIQVLLRHSAGGVTTYYFEATKALRLYDGAVAPDTGLVTGWIADSASAIRDYEVTYKINDDSYKQNDRAVVHGIIPYQDKALWLLEWHGYESEYYTLHDWPTGVRRLIADAYSCS